MKKLILIIGLLFSVVISFAQREVDANVVIVRDSIIMTNGKVTDMAAGINSTDAVNVSQLIDTVNKYSFVEPRDSIQLSTDVADLVWAEGKFYFDSLKQTFVGYNEELDVTFEFFYEDWIRVYNNSGSTILNGKVCYVNGVIVDANNTLTVGLANANSAATSLSALGFATHDIENNSYGIITKSGTVRDANTSAGSTPGQTIFLASADGLWATSLPSSPNFNVRLGNLGKIDAVDGTIEVNINTGSNTQDVIKIFNGAELENATVDVTSNGTICTVSIEKSGGGDLSLFFNGLFHVFDATPAAIITITNGTDVTPVRNWVYIPNSTKVITVNTTAVDVPNGFPTSEQYVPVVDVITPSAATAQSSGFYKVHVWTDHLSNTVGQGHLSDLNFWVRKQRATYQSGVDLTTDPLENVFAAAINISTLSGNVLQLHPHTYPAKNTATGDVIKVYNDFTTANNEISSLNSTDLSADSEGNSLANKYYTVHLWGVVSEDDEDCQYFVSLPSGSYTNSSSALLDASGYTNKRLPLEYKGTAFSMYAITLQNSSTNIKIVTDGIEDLREDESAGGGSGSGVGATVFDELGDTPANKVGSANSFVKVDGSAVNLGYVAASAINVGDFNDDGTYWKNDGTSTATGAWDIGSNSFTADEITVFKDAPRLFITDTDGTIRNAWIQLQTAGGDWYVKSGNTAGGNDFHIGRSADDVINYLSINRDNGNTTFTANLTATNFISNVATGTQSYAGTSTTLNTNLNADLLDGQEGTYYLDYNNFTNTPTIINNHSGLTELDYATAGHTGFAGTGIANTFTENQTISDNKLILFDDTAPSFSTELIEFESSVASKNFAFGWSGGTADLVLKYETSPDVYSTRLTVSSTDVTIPILATDDEAYGAGWNGSLGVPTKNAVYDKIETLGGGGTVTSVTAGTGMTQTGGTSPDPVLNVIGGTGITANADDIAITNTAVTPGSYTNTNVTVNAQGQITAAVNGSGSGVSFGTSGQMPFTNATTDDFSYESGLYWDATGNGAFRVPGYAIIDYEAGIADLLMGTSFNFTTVAANTDLSYSGQSGVNINNDGSLQFGDYGSGANIGTATKWLAVDASGNLIEEVPPTGVPGGATGDIQYNNAGAFGGFGDWDGTRLTVAGISYFDKYMNDVHGTQTTSGTISIDTDDGADSEVITLNGTSTLNLNNLDWGQSGTILVRQDATGSRTLTIATFAGVATSPLVEFYSGGLQSVNPDASSYTSIEYKRLNANVLIDIVWYSN